MFPGQGSQEVGMGRQLCNEFKEARLVFEEAEDAIKTPLRRLCFEGPLDELSLTANQQPSILTVSTAFWRVLQSEAGLSANLFAGHSLGEYSALVASGRLDFAQAVQTVKARGEAMQEAVPVGQGAMAAVLRFDEQELASLCKDYSSPTHVVEVANFNSPQQQIISGHKEAVQTVIERLKERSVKSVGLPVSAPFHSSLMKPAREKMRERLSALTFNSGAGSMIANLTGCIESDYNSSLLIEQIDHPVLWTKTLKTALESKVELYVELGPGKVLTGLAKRSLPKGTNILTVANIAETVKSLSAL